MKIFKNLFLFKKQSVIDNELNHVLVDQYEQISRLVKEERIKKNITIQELSKISKIPEQTIISIETNNKNIRPKYPFIRSILIKLEECLGLEKNTLEQLAIKEVETSKKKNDFIVNKFDLIMLMQGTLLYFFINLNCFILRYFILNVNVIGFKILKTKSLTNKLNSLLSSSSKIFPSSLNLLTLSSTSPKGRLNFHFQLFL